MNLRTKTQLKEFIKPELLRSTQLPTHLEFLRQYIYINDISRDITKIKTGILESLKTIWNSPSIPIMYNTSIINKIYIYTNSNSVKKTQNSKCFMVAMQKHMDKCNHIFDICSCRCANKCDCLRENKIPPSEKPFLKDQRTQRLMYIQTASTTATTKQSRTRAPVDSIPETSLMHIDPRYVIKIL